MITIYAGSFDILTFGHIDVLNTAALMSDGVHMLIANNMKKDCIFTPEERLNIINSYVTQSSFFTSKIIDGLVVDYALEVRKRESNNVFLVRGVRDFDDAVSEMRMADNNYELSGIRTVLLPSRNEYRNYSSSLVRELLKNGKDIKKYCPDPVIDALKKKGLL